MPEDNDKPQETPPEGEKPNKGNEENLRKLREKAEAGDAAMRENAMLKAGINTDSPLGKFFSDSYKGELTKEAVTAAATEIGLLEKETPDPEVSEQEKESTKERQKLTSGAADPSEMPKKHPREEGIEQARRVLDEGGTYEQGGAAYLSTLMQRHQEGDPRATRQKEEGSSGVQRV